MKRRSRSKNWIEQLTTTVDLVLPTDRNGTRERVRIAILDTGIDPQDEFLSGCRDRIKGYRSWVDDAEDGDTNILDEFGHGTHSCALLCTAAPEADICIGRISKKKTLTSPKYIAKVMCKRYCLDA